MKREKNAKEMIVGAGKHYAVERQIFECHQKTPGCERPSSTSRNKGWSSACSLVVEVLDSRSSR